MKILLDAHYIGSHAGGNETYTRSLINGLREAASPHEITLLAHREHTGNAALRGFAVRPLAMHSSYIRVPLLLPLAALRTGADLLHIQYTAPPWCPCPYVVTMHDLVAYKLPETMPFRDRHRLRLLSGNTLRRAAHIFTVTHAMRQEITTFFEIDPARISVTPNALDPLYAPVEDEATRAAVRAKYALPEQYILFVGLLQPRKNLARLARAFAMLVAEGFPHDLVITGKRAWLFGEMLREMESLGLSRRLHFTDYVDQADLPALYSMADCFAFPSLYEGFGIPVTEALACGTPVVASTDPALVEVSGGAALYPDPRDVDSIAAALRKALGDTAWRGEARVAGMAHVRQYTAANLAQAALAGYAPAIS